MVSVALLLLFGAAALHSSTLFPSTDLYITVLTVQGVFVDAGRSGVRDVGQTQIYMYRYIDLQLATQATIVPVHHDQSVIVIHSAILPFADGYAKFSKSN